MAVTSKQTITLSSGAITDEVLSYSFAGKLNAILVNKNGQTLSPVITISESGSLGRDVLSITQTATGDNIYHVRHSTVDNMNMAITNSYDKYLIESQLQVTVTGGDASGTITFQFQYEPVQD